MKVIQELERLGYFFRVQEDGLAYEHFGPTPDAEVVRPLLSEVKAAKVEAIAYLQKRPFTRQTRQVVTFPADSSLAFPAGTWRRLVDGHIEALLSYDDLKTMIYWRDVILIGDSE